jgi:HYR domain/Bacterial Ig-like domain/FG-GAP-like repeat
VTSTGSVCGVCQNTVKVLSGDTHGGVSAVGTFDVGKAPVDIDIADFDGDGAKDLAVANSDSDNVSVLLGTGITGAEAFGAATNFAVGDRPYDIESVDFNGDGKADLATPNLNSDNVSVLLNSTGAADADGDGVPDSYDNCPNDDNYGQADADDDGIGDACDTTDDTTAPQLNLPADITVQATGPAGAQVSWQAPTATDESPANPQVSCDADSGDTFPIGTTTVNCSATDAAGNVASGSFHVTVQDTVQDTTAPKVSTATPTGTGIARNTNLTATFSEKMDPLSITKSTFKLFKVKRDGSTTQITNVSVTLTTDGLVAKLNPFGTSSTLLAEKTKYKGVITTGAKDVAGNQLDESPTTAGLQQKGWTFTTKG